MDHRTLGEDFKVSAIGLGCMGMSEFYGPRDDEMSMRVQHEAIDLGIDFFDTADMYGPHHNEELIGAFLAKTAIRPKIATKFGIARKPGEYRRSLDNSPDYARKACEGSLKRLGVERIDLRTREMLTVAMLSAMGTAQSQLEFHMRAALNTGVTRDEIVEIVLQVSVYAGVPACMNAIAAAKEAFQTMGVS